MSSKLVQAVRQKKLRSRSKSKDKNKTIINKGKDLALNVLQASMQIVYPSEKINALLNGFVKQIENPIVLYNQIYQSNSPQKCLTHNNIQTLYCINDQKLLCAGCMYHSPIHKGHKVVPFNNVQDAIKINLKSCISKIQDYLKICNKVIQKAAQNIDNAQKQYPLLMEQINTFYMNFHQLLVDRRNQQLKLISQVWSKLRYENSTIKMEMNRICTYVKNKLDQTKRRTQIDSLTYNKNIVDSLCNIQSIIKEDIISLEQNPYFKEIKKFKILQELVKNALVLQQIKNKNVESYYKNPKSPKNKSPSLSKKNSLLQSKSPRKEKKVEKTPQQKLIQMHQRQFGIQKKQATPISKNIKNRHSVSQVLLKSQVQIRKKQYEKQQAKRLSSSKKSQSNLSPKSVKNSPVKKAIQKVIKTKK